MLQVYKTVEFFAVGKDTILMLLPIEINVELHLVVIHNSVERLNPHWVNIPVQDDPLGCIALDVSQSPHDPGELAIRPLLGSRNHIPEQLIVGHCFWIQVPTLRFLLIHQFVRVEQCL